MDYKYIRRLITTSFIILLIFGSLFTTACDKEDDNNISKQLDGYWRFTEGNMIAYLDGEKYDAQAWGEEEFVNEAFRGLFFYFNGNKVTIIHNGAESYPATFSVSENKLIIKDSSSTGVLYYELNGNNLIITFNSTTIEMLGLSDDIFYYFDSIEFILSFNKV